MISDDGRSVSGLSLTDASPVSHLRPARENEIPAGSSRPSIAVVVPHGGDCPHRYLAWGWVRAQFAKHHPGWDVVMGTTDVEGFSRTQAIRDALGRTDADTIIVSDADVWCDGLNEAVSHVAEYGWAIPHELLHRLSPESTRQVLDGADWHGLPLSTDNRQDSKPYRGHETGTLCVFRRDVLDQVPPDPRFVGWGSEDDAWALALRALVGKPWRGTADLVHLWHPAEPRMNRVVGNERSQTLLARYKSARRSPESMRALLDEVTDAESLQTR